MIAKVLLTLPFNEPFDYKIEGEINCGDLVRVPFGKETLTGVVWNICETSKIDDKKLKKIIEVLPFEPIKDEMRKFIEFVANYNMAYLGLVLKMVLSVKQVFDDPKMLKYYRLSGKTLAQAKLKNSDARWRVMDFLKEGPFNRSDIAQGAGVSQSVIKNMIEAGVLEEVLVEKKRQYQEAPSHQLVLMPMQ